MNVKRYVIASLVVAAVAFILDSIIRMVILEEVYSKYPQLMGSANQLCRFFWIYIIGLLALGFLMGYIFIKGYENKGIGEGLRFGLLMGLFLWFPTFCVFVTFMPYPKVYDIVLPLAGVIQCVIYGILFSVFYKPLDDQGSA